jgi:L-ascorbate metabolism protein UlaG (beta-lactamase superfamily)
MEITWYGLACFRLRSRALTVVTDPFSPQFGLTLPRLRADVVTISHDVPGHNYVAGVRNATHVFDGPGEYEVNGVFFTGVATHHKGKPGERQRNTAFVIEFEDLTVCHLGDIGVLPDREQVELLSGADVLLLPVGGGDILDAAKAVEIVTELEPTVVIPMHYALPGLSLKLDPVDKFLKEMGLPRPDPLPSYRVSKADLEGEETRVVLLNHLGAVQGHE